ncbi:hypothetical protein [Natrinema gelatinilyticum]|nr:hypothetical protein [Natrinema gelatinilyticum]
MAVIGLPVFSGVLWGSLVGVFLVFLYEVSVLARDYYLDRV